MNDENKSDDLPFLDDLPFTPGPEPEPAPAPSPAPPSEPAGPLPGTTAPPSEPPTQPAAAPEPPAGTPERQPAAQPEPSTAPRQPTAAPAQPTVAGAPPAAAAPPAATLAEPEHGRTRQGVRAVGWEEDKRAVIPPAVLAHRMQRYSIYLIVTAFLLMAMNYDALSLSAVLWFATGLSAGFAILCAVAVVLLNAIAWNFDRLRDELRGGRPVIDLRE